MKTNVQMLRELKDWFPQERGILTFNELYVVKATLHLEKMDELQLRNMRDTAVMFFDKFMPEDKENNISEVMKISDKISAITGVIDNVLWRKGCEV